MQQEGRPQMGWYSTSQTCSAMKGWGPLDVSIWGLPAGAGMVWDSCAGPLAEPPVEQRALKHTPESREMLRLFLF